MESLKRLISVFSATQAGESSNDFASIDTADGAAPNLIVDQLKSPDLGPAGFKSASTSDDQKIEAEPTGKEK